MPINVNPSPNIDITGGLSAAQRAQQRGALFGETSPLPTVPIAAAQGISTSLENYVPRLEEPIPRPEFVDTLSRDSVPPPPITANTTPEELAASSQSVLGARERFQPQVDESGSAVWNPETESYTAKPVPMEQFAEQQQVETQQQADMSSAVNTDNYTDQARAILGIRNEASEGLPAGPKKDFLVPTKDSNINRWADEAAPSMERVASNVIANLFNPDDAYVKSNEDAYKGVAVGLAIADKYNIPDDILKNVLPLVIGISNSAAVEQSVTYRERKEGNEDPQNISGNTITGTMSKENLVNSMMHSMGNALDRMGVSIPTEAIRQLSEAHILAEVDKGDAYIPYKNKEGKWVYAASPQTKMVARNLSRLTGALSGDNKRMLSSIAPQIAGGEISNPGSRLTRNSMPKKGYMAIAADVTKDILGSIAEQFATKPMLALENMIKDITSSDNFKPEDGFSTSVYAKMHKVDRASFDTLKRRISPPRGYNPNDADQVSKFEQDKDKHARDEIENKITLLQYDLDNAKSQNGLRYTGYSHSTANQRLFRLNGGTDILASKSGIRNMLNFGLKGHAYNTDLLDGTRVNTIKEVAKRVFRLKGEDRNKALMELSSPVRSALGLMETAVREYYTFSGDPQVANIKNVNKMPELQVIQMYTPEIGNYLAELGKDYNDWLLNPADSNSVIAQMLGKMPRGEAQHHMNLWDDMFQLQNANKDKKKTATELSVLNYDDGNQNGIFLQALYSSMQAAGADPLFRLGTFDPTLNDMRGYALGQIVGAMKEISGNDNDIHEAWANFFDAALLAQADKLSSELFKVPLMQNSYGKHGSMFFDHILDFLEDPKYAGLVDTHLIGKDKYGGTVDVASALSLGMEFTLNKVIEPSLVKILKSMGRGFAILDEVPTHTGVAGDPWSYSSVDVGFIPDPNKPTDEQISMTDTGTEYITRTSGVKSTSYGVGKDNKIVDINTAIRQNNPSASKGTQFFWNKRTKEFDTFENPLGSSLARLMGVMPIQSTDGDLLKIMLIYVNGDKKIPLPVATVHDSLITNMDTMHIYRNAYNNIAIPRAVPEIAKFAKRLDNAYEDSKAKVFREVGNKVVGIGANGDYPSMGAFFDEIYDKINDQGYAERYMKNYGGQVKWEAKVKKDKAVLDEASKLGWVYGVSNLAVRGNNFVKLFDLAESKLQLSGPNDKRASWVKGFSANVMNNYNSLRSHSLVKQHGIAQMSYAGSGIASGHFAPSNTPNKPSPNKNVPKEDDEVPF